MGMLKIIGSTNTQVMHTVLILGTPELVEESVESLKFREITNLK
jgi:hypothetical protein